MNKVFLIGRVGKDPEIKDFNDRKNASFSLATSETYKDKEGNKQSKTEWHNISIWGKLAEVCQKYVKKGMQLCIEGKIEYRSYEKDNQKKYFTQIVANNFQMLGSKTDNQQQQQTTNINDNENELPF